MLKHLYFYDRNEGQDRRDDLTLKDLKSCEIFTEMGGHMETMSGNDCCAHLISFGDNHRRDGQLPLALQPGVPALRMVGEQ